MPIEYSQRKSSHYFLFCNILVKFHDIANAYDLFSSITNKSNYVYATMFKGYHCFHYYKGIHDIKKITLVDDGLLKN